MRLAHEKCHVWPRTKNNSHLVRFLYVSAEKKLINFYFLLEIWRWSLFWRLSLVRSCVTTLSAVGCLPSTSSHRSLKPIWVYYNLPMSTLILGARNRLIYYLLIMVGVAQAKHVSKELERPLRDDKFSQNRVFGQRFGRKVHFY